MPKSNFIIIYVTAKDSKQAKNIAQKIIQEKRAACVNIVPNVQSVYRWNGKVETSKEVLMIIKSQKSNFSKIADLVTQNHSYELPEIIAVPIVDGSKKYLKWIKESLEG